MAVGLQSISIVKTDLDFDSREDMFIVACNILNSLHDFVKESIA